MKTYRETMDELRFTEQEKEARVTACWRGAAPDEKG